MFTVINESDRIYRINIDHAQFTFIASGLNHLKVNDFRKFVNCWIIPATNRTEIFQAIYTALDEKHKKILDSKKEKIL